MKQVIEHLVAIETLLEEFEPRTDTQAWILVRANQALAEAKGALAAIAADLEEDEKQRA